MSLFADDMIVVHVENPKESTKTLLELTRSQGTK